MDELNLIDYELSKRLAAMDLPFHALIAAAARKADTENSFKLRSVFPKLISDLERRYNSPGGMLPEDEIRDPESTFQQVRAVVAGYMRNANRGES